MPRVLIIDDDMEFRERVAAGLRGQGLEPISAPGARLIRSIGASSPDLLVLGLGASPRDTLRDLARLRTDRRLKGLPAIIVGPKAEPAILQLLARLGVRDFIRKTGQELPVLLERIHQRLEPVGASVAASRPSAAPGAPVRGVAARGPGPSPNPPAAPRCAPPSAPPSGPHSPDVPEPPPLADAVEQLRALSPLTTKSELLERLDNGAELRALSPVVHQVNALAGSASSSLEAVARAIKQDPGVCIKILRLANSVLYCGGGPADTVHKAVMRIGLGQIRQAVAGLAIVDRFGGTALGQRLPAQEFWEHAIACGLIAAAIARSKGHTGETADGHFTTGLLHDVGRVICAEQLGEEYAQVLAQAERLALPLEQVEARLLQVTHTEVADRVLRAWKFPAHMVTPIALHHQSLAGIKAAAPKALQDAAILALADRLAHCLLLGSSGNDVFYPTREFAQALGLDAMFLHKLATEIPDQTTDLKLAMLAQGGGATQAHVHPSWRRPLPARARLAFVSAEPVADGLGLVCERLGRSDPLEPPTVAVVFLATPREQAVAAQALSAMESDHGVQGLPVLIVSPTGLLSLPPGTAGDRRCELLAAPFHLSRLRAALARLWPAQAGASPEPGAMSAGP